jgi:O-antigen/teichoic acid export membrane protein
MTGLLKPTLTLLAGGVVAQAIPLALGPLITRLYTPQEFGQYTLFAAIAINFSVVACARYEYALPLAKDECEVRVLMALCQRALLATTAISCPVAWWLGANGTLAAWAWLPPAVGAAGAVQWLTMWATRAQRFHGLAGARVIQYGGGAVGQVAAGAAAISHGLIVAPLLANVVTLAALGRPAPPGGWAGLWRVPRSAWMAVARQRRDFPLFNTPHAFAGALQDTLAVLLLTWWSGEVAAGFWGLALRYLKAPATLVGGAVSQVLFPALTGRDLATSIRDVRAVMGMLALIVAPLVLVLLLFGPSLFAFLFGERWRDAGGLARALAPYIGMHFVASPLAVVTIAWQAQAWALKLALVGQVLFVGALALGLYLGGLTGGAWAVSLAMSAYFGWYFWSLATWRAEGDDA